MQTGRERVGAFGFVQGFEKSWKECECAVSINRSEMILVDDAYGWIYVVKDFELFTLLFWNWC